MNDFDDVSTFPIEIRNYVIEQKKILNLFINKDYKEWWEFEHALTDMRLGETSFVRQFIEDNKNIEIAVWHVTRIDSCKDYERSGIVIAGGRGSDREIYLKELFESVGLNDV